MKTSRAIALLCVALTVLLGEPASAQSEKLSGRFPPTIEVSLQALIDSARQNGLPTEPLVQRALEGASRGVDPERVVVAVRALATRLASARQTLGPVSEPELVAAASAIYLGVSRERLGQLRRSTDQSLALPLVVLTDLVGQGVPMDTATSLMLSLTSAGVGDASLRALRRSVLVDIRSGVPPATAAAMRARGALLERQPPPRPTPVSRRPVVPPRE